MADPSPKPAEATEAPWHAAFPSPKTTAVGVSREEVLQWVQQGKPDILLIDLRRTDCEGGLIKGSINLPAQSLYHTIPALYKLCSTAGVTKVIWFCGSRLTPSASSRGRGTRAAGWFADYLKEKNETSMESLVLEGGIKGWIAGGEEFVKLMDGYEEKAWL